MCSFIPSLLRSFMNMCLRECVNALMKIKRWIWRTVSELGLNADRIWACTPQIADDAEKPFRECSHNAFFRASLCISSISMVGFHNLTVKQQIPQKITEFSDLLRLTENLSGERVGK